MHTFDFQDEVSEQKVKNVAKFCLNDYFELFSSSIFVLVNCINALLLSFVFFCTEFFEYWILGDFNAFKCWQFCNNKLFWSVNSKKLLLFFNFDQIISNIT